MEDRFYERRRLVGYESGRPWTVPKGSRRIVPQLIEPESLEIAAGGFQVSTGSRRVQGSNGSGKDQ